MKAKLLKKATEIQEQINTAQFCIEQMDYMITCCHAGGGGTQGKFTIPGCGWVGWLMTQDEVKAWAKIKKREAEIELAHKQALFDVL